MKKKFLSILLAIFMVISCGLTLSACTNTEPTTETPPIETPGDETPSDETPGDETPSETVYTVTEEEWKINFNLTKGQTQPQSLSNVSKKPQAQLYANSTQSLAAITSYTISAVGVNYGTNGTCVLKVAPNAMSIEFKLEGVLREDESGITPSSDNFYVGLTSSVMSYFPFAENYDDFTYDQTKKAYVAQNFTTAVVNEEDITDTYDLYTKYAEVTFVNGYLNTITIQLTEDKEYTNVYSSFVFTFSNINDTTVEG